MLNMFPLLLQVPTPRHRASEHAGDQVHLPVSLELWTLRPLRTNFEHDYVRHRLQVDGTTRDRTSVARSRRRRT